MRLIQKEKQDSASRLKAYEALLALVDRTTGELPRMILEALETASAESKGIEVTASIRPTENIKIATPVENTLEYTVAAHLYGKELGSIWTSRSLYDSLSAIGMGFASSRDTAVNTLSTLLIKMTAKGYFERTHQGKGRNPSQYRWIGKKSSEPEMLALTDSGAD